MEIVMEAEKASWLDGLQVFIMLIGTPKNILSAIHDIFKHGKMLKEINCTHICLIPKFESANRVESV